MRKAVLVLLVLITLPTPAFATWSVIAVDRSTGRVVIASATCVDRDDQFLMGVQAVIVPGKGVAACQAAVDPTRQNQMLVFRELQKGTDPDEIIEMLSRDAAYQSRQFGILDLQGRMVGHSGLGNGYVSQDMQGQPRQRHRHAAALDVVEHPGERARVARGSAGREPVA